MSAASIKSIKSTTSLHSIASIETASTSSFTRTTSSVKPILSSPSFDALSSWRCPIPEPLSEEDITLTGYIFPTVGLTKSVRDSSTYIRFYLGLFMAKHAEIIIKIREEDERNPPVWKSTWKRRYDSPSHRRNRGAKEVFDLIEFEHGLKLEDSKRRFRHVFVEDRVSEKDRERERTIEVAPDEMIVNGKIVACKTSWEEDTIPDDIDYNVVTAELAKSERERSIVSEKPRKKAKPSHSGSGCTSAREDNCAMETTDSDSVEEIKNPVVIEYVSQDGQESKRRRFRGCKRWAGSCLIM